MTIMLVVGARPNFMKMAPLYFALDRRPAFEPVIVHTGQHYDYIMSEAFFEVLDLPEPDHYLDVGSGSHAAQTAAIMVAFEKVIACAPPDLVIVFGDVNSTIACAVTARKLHIPVAHVEAGLRSFDMTMPEEINRRCTDAVSNLLFTPSSDGDENLLKENVTPDRIRRVGNIMIDSLQTIVEAASPELETETLERRGVTRGGYALITLHRPSNVDDPGKLARIMAMLCRVAEKVPVLFPMHPRTRKNCETFGVPIISTDRLMIADPCSYREFLILEKNAGLVLTDSGGIQEETTCFHVPCLTLRDNTERPITVIEGTNELVTLDTVEDRVDVILAGKWKAGAVPELWDGHTAERIVEVLDEFRDMLD